MNPNRALSGQTFALLWLIAAACCWGQGLEEEKFKVEARLEGLDQPVEQLKVYYRESLAKLSSQLQSEGDLDAVLQIQGEQDWLAGKTIKRPPDVFPELKRRRGIYGEKMGELLAKGRAEKKSLLEAYVTTLERLQTDYTKGGEIDLAVACKSEIKRVGTLLQQLEPAEPDEPDQTEAAVSLGLWKAPQGGAFRTKGAEMSLVGPGLLQGAAIAISNQELAEGVTLRGECKPNGKWTGFILANSQAGTPYLCVFSRPGHDGVHVELHIDGERRTIGDEAGRWKAGEWVDFELKRKSGRLQISLGRERFRIPIPKEITGGYFGIVAFQESSIFARNLEVE